MSDRRPENPMSDAALDWIETHLSHYDWQTALAAVEQLLSVESVAVVRRQVESGTIKGSETSCNVCQGEGRHVDGRTGDLVTCDRCEGLGRTLVIPVSGRGEDR